MNYKRAISKAFRNVPYVFVWLLLLSYQAIADISTDLVYSDPNSPRAYFNVTVGSQLLLKYGGPIAGGETLVWEKDFDPTLRQIANDNLSFALAAATTSDTGIYQPVVLSPTNPRRGQVFRLDVRPKNACVNLSVRVRTGTAGDSFTVGFVVEGKESVTHILCRGIGPSLSRFGVATPGAVQEMTLYDSAGKPVDTFKPVQSAATLDVLNVSWCARVGAFPALVGEIVSPVAVPPGAYTLSIVPKAGSAGDVLIEVYSPAN